MPDSTPAAEMAQCFCYGPDRPHKPHLPCDMGCQPGWHKASCAVYTPPPPESRAT